MITVPGPAQPAAAGDRAAAALAVHVEGLRKRYGDVTALAGVDLAVRAGEFFTLLGPYVTHDQEEALTMSDRIAVLNQGNIEQIGVPVEVTRSRRRPSRES